MERHGTAATGPALEDAYVESGFVYPSCLERMWIVIIGHHQGKNHPVQLISFARSAATHHQPMSTIAS
eukprot:scaffold234184_cov37-Tisochrysis_lutea.AAC.2